MTQSIRSGHKLLCFVFLAAFAFFLVNVLSEAATSAATTIRVGYPQLNGGQVPLWNIPENKLDQK
jgi:hypothetical protein